MTDDPHAPDDAHPRHAVDLVGPADAVVRLVESLLEEAGDRVSGPLRDDLGKILEAGRRVLGLLGPWPNTDPRTLTEPESRQLRHDLRNSIGHVRNYCELWFDEAATDPELAWVADELRPIHDLGERMLGRVDALLGTPGPTDEPPGPPPPAPGPRDDPFEVPPSIRFEGDQAPAQVGAILVVDDDAFNRDLLARRLGSQGHTVAEAADGEAALAMVAHRPFDLVLLDIVMPGLTGFDVLERLKADDRTRDLPVILISGVSELDSVVAGIQMGAEDYLPKPYNAVLLDARIGACLEKKRLRDRERKYLAEIEIERKFSNDLLRVILPEEIVHELRTTQTVKPRRHENVAVLFADVVGFTTWSNRHEPEEVVAYLQQAVTSWEESAAREGMLKIKTIGDAFMATSGLLRPVPDPVERCIRCGLEMIEATRRLEAGWNLRVGVHWGPVVAGKLGNRQYSFDLWGDTVNTAARMESHGEPGRINLSDEAKRAVEHLALLGHVDREVKGKGLLRIHQFESFRD